MLVPVFLPLLHRSLSHRSLSGREVWAVLLLSLPSGLPIIPCRVVPFRTVPSLCSLSGSTLPYRARPALPLLACARPDFPFPACAPHHSRPALPFPVAPIRISHYSLSVNPFWAVLLPSFPSGFPFRADYLNRRRTRAGISATLTTSIPPVSLPSREEKEER